jgi:hypothetical protein
MQNKITNMSVVTAILISSSANAFWGSEITVKKEHPPVAPEWVKKNNDEVTRTVYQINKSALPAMNRYLKERESLFHLKYLDFDTLPTLDPMQLKLAYNGKQAKFLRAQYVELINSVKLVIDGKVALRQQALLESETISQNYVMQIEALKLNREAYRTTVQAVYDLKNQTIKAQKMSEKMVEDYSSQLTDVLNQHSSIPKHLKSNYFERPKMNAGKCDELIIKTNKSVEVAYNVQGFCFSSRFNIDKGTVDEFVTDDKVMYELEENITAIALEKIMQGETDKKEGGKPGYKQKIKAFSYGGIEDVKREAKEKYGSTEKGLTYKIKSLNKKLASNTRKITSQRKNVSNISHKEVMHSTEMKALKPMSKKLDTLILKYLDASFLNIIGKPIKQSTEDYHLIALDESEGILLIEDTYPDSAKEQVELYIINPSILQKSKNIKRSFDGEDIPSRAAASVDALRLWRGQEAYYPQTAPSLARFLSAL